MQGLDRTGIVSPAFWAKLDHPLRPQPRYTEPADHIEVDIARQVLFVVRSGRVAAIVPVSTAGVAGEYTPRGRFAIYRKVDGFDPSPLGTLYDPMYFTGGYAIHGNPSVPPYPGEPRLRPHADVDRADPLRVERLRRNGVRLLASRRRLRRPRRRTGPA